MVGVMAKEDAKTNFILVIVIVIFIVIIKAKIIIKNQTKMVANEEITFIATTI